MLVGETEFGLGQLIFLSNRRIKHRGVITVDCDHQALIEISPDGMLGDFGATSGAQVACQANFHGNLPGGQFLDQLWILVSGQAMSNTLGSKIQRAPNGFWPGAFSGMGSQPEAFNGGVSVGVAEKFRRGFLFVATDSDSNDVAVAEFRGQFKNILRCRRSELAD